MNNLTPVIADLLTGKKLVKNAKAPKLPTEPKIAEKFNLVTEATTRPN